MIILFYVGVVTKISSCRVNTTSGQGIEQQGISFHRRTGQGGRGGLQPPQSLGNSDFLGSKRKFGQSQFLKTFPCFLLLLLS